MTPWTQGMVSRDTACSFSHSNSLQILALESAYLHCEIPCRALTLRRFACAYPTIFHLTHCVDDKLNQMSQEFVGFPRFSIRLVQRRG